MNEMNQGQLPSPRHRQIRAVLRVGGPILVVLGILMTIIGFASFLTAFGTLESPRYFWCAFVGLPLIFVGGVMCMYGYLGTLYRYAASETAPVAKDVINYMGENIQPGVKAVTKAVVEGIQEAQQAKPRQNDEAK